MALGLNSLQAEGLKELQIFQCCLIWPLKVILSILIDGISEVWDKVKVFKLELDRLLAQRLNQKVIDLALECRIGSIDVLHGCVD